MKLISPESAEIILSTQIGQGSSASYPNLLKKTIRASDGWVEFVGVYHYNNLGNGFVTIYVESSNPTASFYIDDINFEPTGSGPADIERDLQPIKDVYKDYFLIGNAISADSLEGLKLELLNLHFNAVTAENAMKPVELQPEKGRFTLRQRIDWWTPLWLTGTRYTAMCWSGTSNRPTDEHLPRWMPTAILSPTCPAKKPWPT